MLLRDLDGLQPLSARSQGGAATLLYLIAVLPLIAIGLSLGIDFLMYDARRVKLQSLLDEASLRAGKFLPFTTRVDSALRQYLQQTEPEIFNSPQTRLEIRIADGRLKVLATIPTFLIGAGLLGKLTGTSINSPPLIVGTDIRTSNADSLILLDMAEATTAPPQGSTWGGEIEYPAARFFEEDYQFYDDQTLVPPRESTQRCFNPLSIQLKRAGIGLYSYLSAFPLDQVGIGVFPGSSREIDILREPARLRYDESEANFVGYTGHNRGDIYCLAAAEREQAGLYSFPTSTNDILNSWIISNPPSLPRAWAEDRVVEINQSYARNTSVKEMVWSIASRQGSPTEFTQLLEYGMNHLVGIESPAERGSLAIRRSKFLFIVAGGLPQVGGHEYSGLPDEVRMLSDKLQSINQLVRIGQLAPLSVDLRIIYVVVGSDFTRSINTAQFANLRSIASDSLTSIPGELGSVSALFLYAASPEALVQRTIPSIANQGRRLTLAR